MEKKIDKRLKCSDDKKLAIKNAISSTIQKRKNQILKVYELKIVKNKLNSRQKEELERMFVEGKWFYNHVLNLHQGGLKLSEINSTHIKSVDHYDKDRNILCDELRVLKSQQKQEIIVRMIANEKTICKLVRQGLQKFGNLRFRSELNSIPLKQYGTTYKFKSKNKIKVAGIHGDMRVKGSAQLKTVDEYANANLIRKPDGYYLKVTCYIDKDSLPLATTNGKEIGLDFGIKTNITTSEGEKLDVSIEESERLKMLQKKLQHQKKDSNRRYKTIKQIRRQYLKLTNKKKDKANKIVHMLMQYDTIVIQDEQISSWHQQKSMSKVVQHSCMGMIKAKLKQLPQTIVLDKYIPTTKWCPCCHKLNDLSLSDRTYVCECGYSQDRDIHAAQNMLNIKNLVEKNLKVPTERRGDVLQHIKRDVFCEAEQS